jgi:hypothetical protein
MRMTTVASVALVLAMAAPAMAGDGSWTTDRRANGPGHVRYAGDRDGSNRWNDGRRGDDNEWRGDDGRRDVRAGDRRGHGDRGRHLGQRRHDNDRRDNRHADRDERGAWHKKDGNDHRDWQRASREDARNWRETRYGRDR